MAPVVDEAKSSNRLGRVFANDNLKASLEDDLASDTDSQSFELVFRNLGTTDLQVSSNFHVSSVLRVVGVVPEPGSVALLVAGLGLMGWRTRHRHTARTL